jgi:hypothetical protein
MVVTGWNNGSPNHKSGAGYGIRITRQDQERYFKKSWSSITIEFESGDSVDIRLSNSFWRRCSELRNAKIGKWMINNRLAPWPKGSPPNLKLEPIAEGKFSLNLL